jgi:tyrosinase
MGAHGTTYVRREIWGLQPDDPIVTAYANAVKAMRERPEDDPTSWSYQAAIHGTYATPSHPRWNECQHGTWFFLPWHRMFLYHFEQIVRAAVIEAGGPADWALPYWNYGLGGRNATLPLAFRQPKLTDGNDNPLYVAERKPGINSGSSLPGHATSPAGALARPEFIGTAEFGGDRTAPAQFSKSGGELEETPHNVIHVLVGGRGLMGDIKKAAQDPIFWLHHANIDRLWTVWSALPRRSDPTETPWTNQSFEFFNAEGQPVSMRCDEVLATLPGLGYTYDTTPPPTPPPAVPAGARAAALKPPERQLIGASQESIELTGQPASVPVPIDRQAAEAPMAPNQRAYLNVEDIEGESNPGTVYGVYANLPPNAPADLEAAHRIGNLSFFGIERAREPAGDEPAHGLSTSFDVTALARELEAHNEWAGHALLVTFRPVTLTPPEVPDGNDLVQSPADEDRPVTIGRVSVFYDA